MAKPLLLYQTYLSTAAGTATDSYSGSSPDNVLQATEDTYWRPANTTGTKSLDLDLGQTVAGTALAIVGEGLDGAILSVYGDDNSGFTSPETLANAVNLSGPVNCAWTILTSASYRYYRLNFSSFGSAFRVAFVCLCAPLEIPYLATDADLANLEVDGDPLVSPQGLYLGTNQQKTMSTLPIDFGDVTASEYAYLMDFRNNCLKTASPFVFVPDLSSDECFFGWSSGGFSAPYSGGMYSVATINMTTRAA